MESTTKVTDPNMRPTTVPETTTLVTREDSRRTSLSASPPRPTTSISLSSDQNGDIGLTGLDFRMALIYEKVLSVISLPPEARDDEQVISLLPWFQKKSEIFRTLQKDTLIDIIRNCNFKTCERDDIIIKQGETGDCFYVLLRGVVSVFISSTIADAEESETTERHSSESDINDSTDVSDEEEEEDGHSEIIDETNINRQAQNRNNYGNYIAQIAAGKSFGELALISKDCVRNASIIADRTCDLLMVHRDLYNRSLRAAQEKEFEERKEFIDKNPYFGTWPQKYRRQLAMSLRRETVNFETHLMKQGEKVDSLYFIHRGQAKIIMDAHQHKTQFSQLLGNECQESLHDRYEFGVPNRSRRLSEQFRQNHGSLNKRRMSSIDDFNSYRNFRKGREICLIGMPDVIGDIELVTELPTYIQTVTCSQTSEIFALDFRNFERLVMKKMPKTLDLFKESAKLKLESRLGRVQNGEMPLLNSLLQKLNGPKQNVLAIMRAETKIIDFDKKDPVPKRGALIDQHGPGTVFYRIRERGKQRGDPRFKSKANPYLVPMTRLQNNDSSLDDETSMQDTEYHKNTQKKNQTKNNAKTSLLMREKGFGVWQNGKTMTGLEARILAWHMDVEAMKQSPAKSILTDYGKSPPSVTQQDVEFKSHVHVPRSLTAINGKRSSLLGALSNPELSRGARPSSTTPVYHNGISGVEESSTAEK